MGDLTEPSIRYSWRISRPIERDAICLQIFRYEWNANDGGKSAILQLEPEPHWHEFAEMTTIPQSTVEFNGLELMTLIGPYPKVVTELPDFDPRKVIEDKIDRKLRALIQEVMTLEPEIRLDPDASGRV